MAQTWIQTAYAPVKQYLPRWLSGPIRSLGAAFLTPLLFSWRTGHLRSSLQNLAVTRSGAPLPWYSYPCIDFLKYRSYKGKTVMEFGAGQSTLWWGREAQRVVAFEGDARWYSRLKARIPSNVELHLVPIDSPRACVDAIHRIVDRRPEQRFDVIVIDGDWRSHMIAIAASLVTETGIIICDNAARRYAYDGFKDRDFRRVDFFGHAPGVVFTKCTSIFFRPDAFVFDPTYVIPDIARD